MRGEYRLEVIVGSTDRAAARPFPIEPRERNALRRAGLEGDHAAGGGKNLDVAVAGRHDVLRDRALITAERHFVEIDVLFEQHTVARIKDRVSS